MYYFPDGSIRGNWGVGVNYRAGSTYRYIKHSSLSPFLPSHQYTLSQYSLSLSRKLTDISASGFIHLVAEIGKSKIQQISFATSSKPNQPSLNSSFLGGGVMLSTRTTSIIGESGLYLKMMMGLHVGNLPSGYQQLTVGILW